MNTNEKILRLSEIYAKALFELAEQSQLVDNIKKDLDTLADIGRLLRDFETLMASSYFSEEYKKNLVQEVFSENLNPLTINFLMVVIDLNRMRFLPQITERYDELWETYHGYHRVKVTVSGAMNNEQIERLTDNIAASMNSRVRLELAVDPSIIGGVIIRYGDKVIDNSVRTRLQMAVRTIAKEGMNL